MFVSEKNTEAKTCIIFLFKKGNNKDIKTISLSVYEVICLNYLQAL